MRAIEERLFLIMCAHAYVLLLVLIIDCVVQSDTTWRQLSMAASVSSNIWFKVAGLVGASGVALAAYGAHGFKPADEHFALVFKRANEQQMYHAALLAVAPVTRCVGVGVCGRYLGELLVWCSVCCRGRWSLPTHLQLWRPCDCRRRPHLTGSLALAGLVLFSGR